MVLGVSDGWIQSWQTRFLLRFSSSYQPWCFAYCFTNAVQEKMPHASCNSSGGCGIYNSLPQRLHLGCSMAYFNRARYLCIFIPHLLPYGIGSLGRGWCRLFQSLYIWYSCAHDIQQSQFYYQSRLTIVCLYLLSPFGILPGIRSGTRRRGRRRGWL